MESAKKRSIPADEAFAQVIEGPRVTLVAVGPQHRERLWEIRDEPEVFRWWGPIDPDFPFDEDEHTPGYTIMVDGDIAGFVQFYEEREPMYRHASIDIFLTTARHGQGLGRETVRVLAAHLIDVRRHHRLTIDPTVENHRAVACYSAVGFSPVGVLRASELSPEGVWRDGLLMDMLAAELVR